MAPIVTATLSSSSTTSSRPSAMLGRPSDRQRDAEHGPPAHATAQFDRTAVRLDDPLRHPQTQARALFVFGREEGLEDMRQVLFSNALACVTDLDMDRVRHQEL